MDKRKLVERKKERKKEGGRLKRKQDQETDIK